jgi:hypothetical protein
MKKSVKTIVEDGGLFIERGGAACISATLSEVCLKLGDGKGRAFCRQHVEEWSVRQLDGAVVQLESSLQLKFVVKLSFEKRWSSDLRLRGLCFTHAGRSI